MITGVSPLHDDGELARLLLQLWPAGTLTRAGQALAAHPHSDSSKSSRKYVLVDSMGASCQRCNVARRGGKALSVSTSQPGIPRIDHRAGAHPGYFGIQLANDMELETTSTAHAALHRFTFHHLINQHGTSTTGNGAWRARQEDGDDGAEQGGHVDRPVASETITDAAPERPVHTTDDTPERPSTPAKPKPKPAPPPPPPPPANKAIIQFDATEDLAHSFQWQGGIRFSTTDERQVARVSGWGQYVPSFGANWYKVYFCLDVPGVKSMAYYSQNNEISVQHVHGRGEQINMNRGQSGGLFEIDGDYLQKHNFTIQTRIGVSWANENAACKFVEDEIPNGRWERWADFEVVRSKARQAWDDLLGVVTVDTTGVENDVIVDFWTSMYRSFIAPTNITGDQVLWESSEPYWDSFYCIWDSFRVVHPLYAITARVAQAEIIRALIDVWRHRGWLPDCRMSLAPGWTQGGSDGDSLLADSFVKNITKGIDWNAGLRSVITDATVTPGYWDVEGRSAIERRKQLGYVPVDDDTPGGLVTRSGSKTLEYAFNDFGIALMADAFGLKESAAQYYNASGDWINLWNPNTTSAGFNGFIIPRYISACDLTCLLEACVLTWFS